MAGLREDALCSVQPPEPNHVKMSLKSHSPVSHENLLCSSPFRMDGVQVSRREDWYDLGVR